jgi:hypothetical protein
VAAARSRLDRRSGSGALGWIPCPLPAALRAFRSGRGHALAGQSATGIAFLRQWRTAGRRVLAVLHSTGVSITTGAIGAAVLAADELAGRLWVGSLPRTPDVTVRLGPSTLWEVAAAVDTAYQAGRSAFLPRWPRDSPRERSDYMRTRPTLVMIGAAARGGHGGRGGEPAIPAAPRRQGSPRKRESVSKITTWRDGGGIAAAFCYPDTGKGGRGNRPDCSAGMPDM